MYRGAGYVKSLKSAGRAVAKHKKKRYDWERKGAEK